LDDALALHGRALALREQADAGGPDVAMSLSNLAAVLRERGQIREALAEYRRALAIVEAGVGAEHPYAGDALLVIGVCTHTLGQLDESARVLERALAIRNQGSRPVELAEVQLALGRTLWDRGRRDRALELARAARNAFAASPASQKKLAETEAWLRARE
jgi:tetratricopeptide (TPR) repeat protein